MFIAERIAELERERADLIRQRELAVARLTAVVLELNTLRESASPPAPPPDTPP